MLCSLAASITSSSRFEPPGSITAVMPDFFAWSILSLNGKNASEAITAPAVCSPAISQASLALLIRDICPAPVPISVRFLAKTIALLLTCLHTSQANLKSLS